MVLLIIIPIKCLFHWEYTQHFQTYPYYSNWLDPYYLRTAEPIGVVSAPLAAAEAAEEAEEV